MSLTPTMPEKLERELAPAGTHRAVLYKLVNLGTMDTEWEGKPKKSHKIRLVWELTDEVFEYEVDGEKKSGPFAVGRKFTFSLGDNAHLTPIVEGMLGTKLNEDERRAFDIEKLLGTPCMITVIHDEYNGNKFAKVTSASVLPKSMEKPKQQNETVIWDVRKFSQEEIADLPEYIREDMEASDEYKVRFLAERS